MKTFIPKKSENSFFFKNHLLNDRRSILWTLVGISLLYFILFIPINFSGSDELSKIRIFSSIDEYVQLKALEKMLDPADKKFKQIIGDYLLHSHAYGYPFYFFSSIPVIPIKLLGLPRPEELQWMMLLLRQQVIIFNIITCLLLTFLWTGFKKLLPTFLLFLFLLTIPAVIKHNLLWHPDALSTLFLVFTLFCLIKDQFQFNKWYILSAVSCGMAFSTKFMGPFLFLMILTYLVLGIKEKKLNLQNLFLKGMLFFIITVSVFVLSSPLILFGYSQNIINFLILQSTMNNFGWGIELPKGLMPWYEEIIKPLYFNVIIIIALLIITGFSIVLNKKTKYLNILIMAAILPLFIYVVSVIGHKNYLYLYPVLLIFGSTAGNIYKITTGVNRKAEFLQYLKPYIFIIGLFIMIVLIVTSGIKSIGIYQEMEVMKSQHPSYNFYQKMVQENTFSSNSDHPKTILLSSYIYLPDSLKVKQLLGLGLFTHDLINKEEPDIIIFERELGNLLIEPTYQQKYVDPQKAREAGQFYKKAMMDSLPGYSLTLSDKYGFVLMKSFLK